MLSSSNIADALLVYDGIIKKGFDGSTFLGGMAAHFRNLAVSKETKTQSLLDVSESFRSKYLDQANDLSFAFILNGLNAVSEAEEKYKQSRNPRLLVELMLMKLGHLNSFIQSIPSLEEVKKKIGQSNEVAKAAPFKRSASIVEDKPKSVTPPIPPTNVTTADLPEKSPAGDAQSETVAEVKTAASTIQDVAGKSVESPIKDLAPNQLEQVAATRLKVGSFEEFKRKKAATTKPTDEIAKPTTEQGVDAENRVDQSVIESVAATVPVSAVAPKTLDEFWVDFYQPQTPRVLTCLKGLKYAIEDNVLVVTLNASHQESIIEEIRPQMMQAIRAQIPHLNIQGIQSVVGKIEVQERRPYTDKEKLEYLMKKHPGLAEALESLHLRLP
jgi:DNA polymerase-3 subunit gamma/tau